MPMPAGHGLRRCFNDKALLPLAAAARTAKWLRDHVPSAGIPQSSGESPHMAAGGSIARLAAPMRSPPAHGPRWKPRPNMIGRRRWPGRWPTMCGTRPCLPDPALRTCVLTRLRTAVAAACNRPPPQGVGGVLERRSIMMRHAACPRHRRAAARGLRQLELEAVGAQRAGVRLQQRRQLRRVLRRPRVRRLVPIARTARSIDFLYSRCTLLTDAIESACARHARIARLAPSEVAYNFSCVGSVVEQR